MLRALSRQASIWSHASIGISRGCATSQRNTPKLWMVHKLKGESVSHVNTSSTSPSMLKRLRQMGIDGNLRAIGNLDPPSSGLVMVTTSKFAAAYLWIVAAKLMAVTCFDACAHFYLWLIAESWILQNCPTVDHCLFAYYVNVVTN